MRQSAALVFNGQYQRRCRLIFTCFGIVCWCLIWPVNVHGQASKSLQAYYSEGLEACNNERYQVCLESFRMANKLRQGHQIILYHLARAYSYNNLVDSSALCLKKALVIKADLDMNDDAFHHWRSSPKFKQLLALRDEQMQVVNKSDTVTVLQDRLLHIESIAHDHRSSRLFLGSVHKRKILEVNLANGRISEFAGTAEHGLWSVFGMKADTGRRHLWVCSVATNLMLEADSSIEESSAIYKFDLDSGKIIHRYQPMDSLKHWFGDLTLARNGDLYISDSRQNSIWSISSQTDSLALFYHNGEFISIQGLDLDHHNKHLFLADYVNGPYVLSLANKNLTKIANGLNEVSLKSIDGLYFYDGSLIATQNQVVPMRVSRYYLNQEFKEIIDYQVLEKNNPILNEPTLGVVAHHMGKDWFYYVANSQWGGYDGNGKPKPSDELQDIHIMKVLLD